MKKTLLILAFAALLLSGFSSCKKLMCKCTATGHATEAQLEVVLDRHINDCVDIAESGPIIDNGITVSCSY
jgi:hypothetical protein